MPRINQDKKKIIAAALKVVMKAYPSIKYSLSIQHNSSITCSITQGPKFLDPNSTCHIGVNVYWIDTNSDKEAAIFLTAIKDCLNGGNHDNSVSQTDYFDVGWHTFINIGKWNKPFIAVE